MGSTVTTVTIGARGVAGAGDDLGNRLIPTSNNTDRATNKNSCLALNAILLNMILPPAFKNLMKHHPTTKEIDKAVNLILSISSSLF